MPQYPTTEIVSIGQGSHIPKEMIYIKCIVFKVVCCKFIKYNVMNLNSYTWLIQIAIVFSSGGIWTWFLFHMWLKFIIFIYMHGKR